MMNRVRAHSERMTGSGHQRVRTDSIFHFLQVAGERRTMTV
jgi:hypothetical protein